MAEPDVPGVLHVLPYGQDNGTERHVLVLCRYLHARGIPVAVASPAGPIVDRLAQADIPWVGLPPLSLVSFPGAVRKVARHAEQRRFPIIHVHAAMEFCWALHWACSGRSDFPRPSLVFTSHCYHTELDYMKAGLFLAPCQQVLAVSDAERSRLVRYGVSARRCQVVLNGMDHRAFPASPMVRDAVRQELGLHQGDRLFGFIGRLARPKGASRLVRTFGRLIARHPEGHLALVGEGPERTALDRQIAKLGEVARTRIHLLGRREDIPAFLAACDVYVSASRREGLSLAAIEALFAGKPLLVPDLPEFHELVRPGHNGLVFARNDDESLLVMLEAMVMDKALERYAVSSRSMAPAFHAERMGDRILSIYEQLGLLPAFPLLPVE